MKIENLQRLVSDGVSFDVETHLIQPGLGAPPLVCAAVATLNASKLLGKREALDCLLAALDSDKIIIGTNIKYDLIVMSVYAESIGLDILPQVFKAYQEDRVYCILLAEQLHALAQGHLGRDPETGADVFYSQDYVAKVVLGRDDAKANDRWRRSYALLEHVPFDKWPDDARQYPIDDVEYALAIALKQAKTNRNSHDLSRQCFADFAMGLGAVWGLLVNQDAVTRLEETTLQEKLEGQSHFLEIGLLKEVKERGGIVVKKDSAAVRKSVAKAFGCVELCPSCEGSGREPSTSKHKDCVGDGCPGTKSMVCRDGRLLSTKKTKNCTVCYGTGYDLDSAPIPRTDKGGVSTGRDPLYESGEEVLIDFAAWSEKDKILSTYTPWLRGGSRDGKSIPLTLKPRVLKETGRSGYGDVVHQLPRGGGVRETIEEMDGWVLCSADYEGAELRTHAQSCLNIVGWSNLADALNSGVKVHDKLGAKIGGVSYEYMLANKHKETSLKNFRNSAKPPNFGFPGLMGAATLVLQQRVQGPDTVAPTGKVYKGLRFCLLASDAQACGLVKVTQWGKRAMPPTCKHCLEIAEDIRKLWLEEWAENVPYFAYVERVYERGELVQHWSKRIRGGASLCATANSFFQGLAGDIMKLAHTRVAFEQYVVKSSPLYGTRTILPIHDELLVSMPEDIAGDAAARLSEVMVGAMVDICPDMEKSAVVEAALMRSFDKRAEPVFDKEGKLTVWEP